MSDKKEVNLSGLRQNKSVWLVKVPKYLSQQWEKVTEKGEVGKISIEKKQGKTEVCFTLNEELAAMTAAGEKEESLQAPREYPFTMHTVGAQTMVVFSQADADEVSLEGTVVHRAECRPVVSDSYMKVKRLQVESVKPQRLVQQLDRAVATVFKPVANHDFNLEYEKKKKSDGKMVRADRQLVLDLLFSAFEKHQYYSFKDLVDITKQPVTYLKEIMREIGVCNRKGVHKSTWELKPEYRHHQPSEEEEQKSPSSI
ncbi:general transcription factor IIF subunit 2-like [Poecilia latipinna]|uniref:General transcription factor IIF subunit 2 n=2 Tax=Poecilia TaxID=8080 RepID=A0A3B3UAC5_9TELE|nr:PREDICTED: general transcription factor IIF subunit 2-like [Poecilia latipinna]XP_014892531.1 PREDICTED: general transcription factor IIF subunit 2-like [Poecilia latipinna]XP_014892532.1 PREDICTED: general transcription factor IIF subunit 2-like [Poecilia latipinna]